MTHRAFSDSSLARLGIRMRELKQAINSAESFSGDFAEFAGLTMQTLEEINEVLEAKLDVPSHGSFQVPVTGWTTEDGIEGRFRYSIIIALDDLKETDQVNLSLTDEASIVVASACGLASITESLIGGVRLWAMNLPTQTMNMAYSIMKL